MLARPEYLAVLPAGKVISLSPSGYLMDATKTTRVYMRLRVQDMLATTWEVHTAEQLAALSGANQAV